MKIHLILRDSPITEQSTYLAICGEPVPNCAVAMIWDEQAMGEAPVFRSGCRKCAERVVGFEANPTRYVYGVYDRKLLKGKNDKAQQENESA